MCDGFKGQNLNAGDHKTHTKKSNGYVLSEVTHSGHGVNICEQGLFPYTRK